MHTVGVPIVENCTRGMKKQILKLKHLIIPVKI